MSNNTVKQLRKRSREIRKIATRNMKRHYGRRLTTEEMHFLVSTLKRIAERPFDV